MSMKDADPHIRIDEHGVVRVGRAGVPIDVVLGSFHRCGSSQRVCEHRPALTPEEVEAAMRYATNNPDDVDPQLAKPDAAWRQGRIASD